MAYEILTANLPGGEAVAIRAVVPITELQQFFGPAFHELSAAIAAEGAQPAGPPFVRYYTVNPGAVELEAVMGCDGPVAGSGRVKPLHLDASPAVVVRHVGRYDKMKPAYDAITRWMSENGKRPTEAPREVYLTAPDEVPDPSEWVTLVEQPIDDARRGARADRRSPMRRKL